MPPTPVAISFDGLFFSLASEIGRQQARLDEDYRARLTAFLFLLRAAKELGAETLAREIAPASLALNNTEIETEFRFARSREEQSAVKIQPLDIGFMRRYAYSEFAQSRLLFKVERIPFAPKPRSKN
jgi:hypothetical protein